MHISSAVSRPLQLHWHLFYLLIVFCAKISENRQLSQPSCVCVNQNDIRTLYGTRTCLSQAESGDGKIRSDVISNCSRDSFDIRQVQLGVEVRGINLSGPVSVEQITRIREDVHKYKLLIFKDQGVVSGVRQVEISRWFGELECTLCEHERSPHPDILRMSNNGKEGRRNVGRKGWHVDGAYLVKPHGFSIYHIIEVPKLGNTVFVDLKEVLDSVSVETRQRWDRLWMFCKRWKPPVYHPLVYTHPISKQPTLCFHLATIDSFVWDYGADLQRMANDTETQQIKNEIHQEITKEDQRLVYSHKWEPGDFIISDNLALGHKATPETQWPVFKVGLRVLHRTTVKGLHRPQK